MVHSTKHVISVTPINVSATSITVQPIIEAVAVVDKNIALEVEEGATIKAVFIEAWITSNGSAQSSAVVSIEKQIGGSGDMVYGESVALTSYPNKKNIFYVTEGLTPPNTQNPVPFIRNWLKIPKGKQRFGLGDKLVLNFSGIVGGNTLCGLFIFKEYT